MPLDMGPHTGPRHIVTPPPTAPTEYADSPYWGYDTGTLEALEARLDSILELTNCIHNTLHPDTADDPEEPTP